MVQRVCVSAPCSNDGSGSEERAAMWRRALGFWRAHLLPVVISARELEQKEVVVLRRPIATAAFRICAVFSLNSDVV